METFTGAADAISSRLPTSVAEMLGTGFAGETASDGLDGRTSSPDALTKERFEMVTVSQRLPGIVRVRVTVSGAVAVKVQEYASLLPDANVFVSLQ